MFIGASAVTAYVSNFAFVSLAGIPTGITGSAAEIKMSKLHLNIVFLNDWLNTKKENKNLKKREIRYIFIKTNWTNSPFNMIWLMEIQRIYLEEHDKVLHDKACNGARIKNMMDINVNLLHWLTNILITSLLVKLLNMQINLLLKAKLCKTSN